jgi:predicted dehydrogenase
VPRHLVGCGPLVSQPSVAQHLPRHGAGVIAAETLRASGPEPFSRELRLCLDACARRTPPVVDVEAGLLALRVVEPEHRSSNLGRRVLLSELN